MSVDKWGEIIRSQRDNFCTPNICSVNSESKLAEVSLDYFRAVKQETELFLFIEFENKYYYPLWLEFRSINNHVLFLTEELGINSFNLLRRVLQSSMAKEEKWVNEMKALVYHSKTAPKNSHLLKDFTIESDHSIHIHE